MGGLRRQTSSKVETHWGEAMLITADQVGQEVWIDIVSLDGEVRRGEQMCFTPKMVLTSS
jgi:hypothetical protein